jgi:hypothetical protein
MPKNLHLHLESTPAPIRRHLRPAEPAEKVRDRPGQQGERLRGGREREERVLPHTDPVQE